MSFDGLLQELPKISDLMNKLTREETGEPKYDIMSDLLFWDDEVPDRKLRKPKKAFWALKLVMRFRTTLILGSPDNRFLELWETARSLFPQWVGFTATRCKPDTKLAETYEKLKHAADEASGLNDLLSSLDK